MPVRKPDAPGRQLIQVRRFYFGGPVTAQIPVAEVICINKDHIGTPLLGIQQMVRETKQNSDQRDLTVVTSHNVLLKNMFRYVILLFRCISNACQAIPPGATAIALLSHLQKSTPAFLHRCDQEGKWYFLQWP